ncbi:MAG: hypothetical protein FWH21_00555 [Kiritimatiellaeota bacterium]|nr:hypothetical protein [Kiritimatiellota bacterium]
MAIPTRIQLGQTLADGRLFTTRVPQGFPHTMEFTGGVFSPVGEGGAQQPPSAPRLYVALMNRKTVWWDAVWDAERLVYTLRVGSQSAAVVGQGKYMVSAISDAGELGVGQGDWHVYSNIALMDGTAPADPDDPEGTTVNQSLADLWTLFGGLGGTFRGVYAEASELPDGAEVGDIAVVASAGESVLWSFDGGGWVGLPFSSKDWLGVIAAAVSAHNEDAGTHGDIRLAVGNAQSAADTAKAYALLAQDMAAGAEGAAANAKQVAAAAQAAADGAQVAADTAQTTADGAVSAATAAQTTAEDAQTTATNALSAAANAQSTADGALSGLAEKADKTDIEEMVESAEIRRIVSLTESEYALLSPPDPETLYIVMEE